MVKESNFLKKLLFEIDNFDDYPEDAPKEK